MKKNKKKGFTLVELIIAMAILAILVGLLVPNVIRYIEKAREAKDKSTLDGLYTAVTTALADEKAYDAFADSVKSAKGASIWIDEGSGDPNKANEGTNKNTYYTSADLADLFKYLGDKNAFVSEVHKTFNYNSVKDLMQSKMFKGQDAQIAFKMGDNNTWKVVVFVKTNLTGDEQYYMIPEQTDFKLN